MKNILIIGAGKSGIGACKLALIQEYNVKLTDSKKIDLQIKNLLSSIDVSFEEGGHSPDNLEWADEIIISPGISFNKLKKSYPEIDSKKFISEIEFASRFTDAFIIAVTGSNGKTTTATLIYHILKNAGLNVGLAGNIGVSFASSVCDYSYDYYVLEVSSFQLDHSITFKPNISVITNISPDHLDRYDEDFDLYTLSKYSIVKNQKPNDFFVYNNDCNVTKKIFSRVQIKSKSISFSTKQNRGLKHSIYTNKNNIISSINKEKFMLSTDKIQIKGIHNIQNSMAAISVAQILKISNQKIKESLKTFKSIPHRLEHFLTIHKVKYINDSKATNVNSVYYALNSFDEPIIWVVGGIDKGNNYDDLIPLVKRKVKAIICLGKQNKNLIDVFSKCTELIISTDNMSDAVNSAYKVSKPGDVVLLSPACSSFDLFDSYEDRGNKFKEEVRKL